MAGSITPRAAFDAALEHMTGPFAWGLRTDCTVACVAFEALHGVDPLGAFASDYRTARGAYRITRRAGGYLEWCRATFDLKTTSEPRAGDLTLIESADPLGAALALCIQPGEFASKTETGMAIRTAQSLEAWTCHF